MTTMRVNGHEYAIRKVYLVICELCNEDIGRAQSGDDAETLAEAKAHIREHDKVWHPRGDAMEESS